MGNENTSRIVQAPDMETNQGELARPPIVRFNIGAEDSGFFSENRKPDNAVLNAATERSSLANFLILPPKQAEVFGSPQNVANVVRISAANAVYRKKVSVIFFCISQSVRSNGLII